MDEGPERSKQPTAKTRQKHMGANLAKAHNKKKRRRKSNNDYRAGCVDLRPNTTTAVSPEIKPAQLVQTEKTSAIIFIHSQFITNVT